jgi:poly(A) polymerase Pap1
MIMMMMIMMMIMMMMTNSTLSLTSQLRLTSSFFFYFFFLFFFFVGADIDTLCVFPKHVEREHFFTIMYDMLNGRPEVSELTVEYIYTHTQKS